MSLTLEPSRPKLRTLEEEDKQLLNGSSDFNDVAMPDSPTFKKSTFDPTAQLDSLLPLNNDSFVSEDVEMVDLSSDHPDLPKREDMDSQIKRLQAELFREESKLILLKKVFQLQNPAPKIEKKEDPVVERKGHLVGKTNASGHSIHQNGIKPVKGPVDGLKNDKLLSRDSRMQSILKGGPANNNQRSSGLNQSPSFGVAELSRSLAQKSLYKSTPNQNAGAGNYTSRNSTPQILPNKPQQNPVEQLEQQLSSERLVLKRQMEKSVLQVNPPKPPIPDINFIPATICPDFIALLGMELAANYAINSKNLIDHSPYLEPYLCAKCGEDVCPAWKVDKQSGVVVCEPCYVSCRSNAARASHIENLRKAFSTVLEKGKELDRQHTSVLADVKSSRPVPKPVSVPTPVFAANPIPRSQSNIQHNNSVPASYRGSSKAVVNNHVPRTSLPPAPAPRNSGKPPISSPFAPMAAPSPFAPSSSVQKHNQTFGNPLQGIRHSQDAQRQYLLDLISRSPKQQSNHNQWRK